MLIHFYTPSLVIFVARPRASLSQGGVKRFSVVLGVFRFAPLLVLLSRAALLFFSPLVVLSGRGVGLWGRGEREISCLVSLRLVP